MPYRQSSRWVEAWCFARIITLVWVWALGALVALGTLTALVYWLIPAAFFWLVFGLLLGG